MDFYNDCFKIKLRKERVHHHIHVLIIFPDSVTEPETTTFPLTTQTTPVTTQATQCKPCIYTTALLLLHALLCDVHLLVLNWILILMFDTICR